MFIVQNRELRLSKHKNNELVNPTRRGLWNGHQEWGGSKNEKTNQVAFICNINCDSICKVYVADNTVKKYFHNLKD